MLPSTSNYLLKNAGVPVSLSETQSIALNPNRASVRQAGEGLCLVDVEIAAGTIAQIIPAGTKSVSSSGDIPVVDLQGGLVWPCFVDMHTHLDKGHIWERSPNPDGTFASAIEAVQADAQKNWNADDVYQRMEVGLKGGYAHGTTPIAPTLAGGAER